MEFFTSTMKKYHIVYLWHKKLLMMSKKIIHSMQNTCGGVDHNYKYKGSISKMDNSSLAHSEWNYKYHIVCDRQIL